MRSVGRDRGGECGEESIARVRDPSWTEREERLESERMAGEKEARLFACGENHETRRRQVHPLREGGTRSRSESELESSEPRNCSRLSGGGDEELSEVRQSPRRSPEEGDECEVRRIEECKVHRIEEIPEKERLTRRQRLHRTSRSRSTSASRTIERDEEEWRTKHDYVDLIVHRDNEQRDTQRRRRDSSGSSFSTSSSRRTRIPPYLATLLIISYTLFGIADACSSRSTPKPRPPPVTSRKNITFHMYTCPPDYAEWYCLNGATCFTVKIQESLLYNCICSDGFIGQRCEFKDLDGSYLPSRQRVMLETASIAGGATIAVFLVVIICIAAYIHCKRKQKELRTSSTCVDTVDGPGRDPELRPFSNRSLTIFMAKNPKGPTISPSIEQTRMPAWNDYSQMESARMASVNEGKRGTSQ